uniref:Protein FLC EXPRESSOR n=1 Tax=Opuntia streptacantha TaxID=393608 RepID=A0A7C9EXV6_OPUST
MAGRQRGPPPITMEDHRILRRAPPPAAVLEERIAFQHREIHSLLVDNQRLAATHVALKQELAMADQEVRQLAAAAHKVREERELEVKEVFEKSLKVEAEARAVDSLNAELARVRDDVQRLTESKIELTAQLKAIEAELESANLAAREVPAIRADMDAMHQELQKGRAAIEFEKKTQEANLEHRRAMERNMMTMQREIDRLMAELANAEKRARAAAAAAANPSSGPVYMGNYGSPDMVYGGGSYPVQYPMHQVQSITDGGRSGPYGTPPTGGRHPFDIQQSRPPKG